MSQIDNTAYISNTNIGSDSVVYRNARIVDSLIRNNVIIGESSVISKSTLNDHVQINRNSMIRDSSVGMYSYGGMNLTLISCEIGKFTSISWNISIGGANHDYNRVTTHAFLYNPSFGLLDKKDALYDRFTDSCIIGNDVWIGAGSQVLRGVTVGDGAVIGAGSIVTKDVEPYSIVMGIPAIKKKMRFNDKTIDRLEKIKWWDFDPEVIKNHIEYFASQPSEYTLSLLEEIAYSIDEHDKRIVE